MMHNFDIQIAEKYGLQEAVFLNNLIFWLAKNKANDKHYYDGYYWTYNSVKAYEELFPYFTFKQIRGIIERLEKLEIIKSGNYNENPYDRTKWYTIIDKSIFCMPDKTDVSLEAVPNAHEGNCTLNTDIKPNSTCGFEPTNESVEEIDYGNITDKFNEICTGLPKVRFLSESRKKKVAKRIKEIGSVDSLFDIFRKIRQSDFLMGRTNNKWKASFDWLFENDFNWVKVMEGNYDNKFKQEAMVKSKFRQPTMEEAMRGITELQPV